MTKPTISTQILAISTAQKVIQDLPNGVIAVNREYVQLREDYFLDLFQDKPFEVVDRKRDKEYPFEYTIHQFGTRFMTISNNGNPTRKHPIQELAEQLMDQWKAKGKDVTKYGLAYHEGNYKIVHTKLLTEGQQGLLEFRDILHADKSDKELIEQIILDHMEGLANGN